MAEIDSVDVRISASGAEATLAQLVAVRDTAKAMAGQTIALKTDTTALKSVTTEAAAAEAAIKRASATQLAVKVDTSQIAGARTAVQALERDAVSAGLALSKLAAPAAFGAATVGLEKFAADYQTLLVTTANQTNMTTREIALMDQTIRDLPSGDAPLASLANGFKNITDLGYSAADAQKIATEESKAATAAGADQATTMLAVTSAMKEYNASADQVGAYTNTITEAARLGNTSLQAWTEGTRRATAVAAAYGVPLEQVDAALVALTRHGFDASESSTQVAGMLQHIINPSKEAQGELAKLSRTTGIDLVGDFSLFGVRTKGLSGVLDDLRRATGGNEQEVTRLIPALRGGQGALILTTQATGDFNDALGLLRQTMDGSLRPVEEGFARIQETAGYQWGQFTKQLKFDLIDLGQAALPAATGIARAFGDIPAPVIKAGVEVGLFAAGIRTVGVAGDLLVATTAKLGASAAAAAAATARNTAAMEAERTAAAADAAALEALNAARLQGDLSPSIAAALERDAAIAEAKVATHVEVEAAEVVTASAAAKVGSAVAGIGATLGEIAVPVTIGLIAGDIVEHFTIGKIEDAINRRRANGNPDTAEAEAFVQNVLHAPDPATAARLGKNYVDTLNDEIAAYQERKKANAGLGLHGTPFEGIANWAGLNKDGEIDALINKRKQQIQEITDAAAARTKGVDPSALSPVAATGSPALSDAEIANLERHYELLAQKRDELLAKGAPASLVNHVLYPEDFALSKEQLAEYKKDLAEWERQYQAAQKAFTAAQTALGKVDISKGLANLSASAVELRKVQEDLAKVGLGNSHVDALQDIASRFADIAAAENQATAAYNGYMLTLSATDKREQFLDGFKKQVDDAIQAAQEAVDRGTASPDQIQLLRDAPTIYARIAETMGQLKANAAGDVLGMAKSMPDLVKADDITRGMVARWGGENLIATVKAETTDAKRAIDDLIKGPYTATVKVTVAAETSGLPVAGGAPATGGAVANAAGWNRFAMLSEEQYLAIVADGAGGKQSPFANHASYMSLMQAAFNANVDPRVMLAFTKAENGNATNISPELIAAHNYGGIQFAGQPGAHDAGFAEPGHSVDYAAFENDDYFFGALARNLSTGDYADLYRRGDLYGVAHKYAEEPGNRVEDYARYHDQYPAAPTGSGGADSTDPRFDKALGGAGQQVVSAAMQHLGAKEFIDLCEKFAEQMVEEATGRRGATGIREGDANAAFFHARSMGLERGAGEQPQVGDLVYYTDDKNGHVAIYMGDGRQVSTADRGGIAIHTEAVGPNAHYVRIPGVTDGTTGSAPPHAPDAKYAPEHPDTQAAGSASGAVGRVNYTEPSAKSTKEIDLRIGQALYTAQSNILAGLMQELGGSGSASLTKFFGQAESAEKLLIEQGIRGAGKDGSLTPAQQQEAASQAASKALDIEIAMGRAMADMRNHTGDVAADLQRIRDLGGPIGDNLARQVVLWGQIQEANAKVASDQKAIADLEAANTARKQREQAADQAASRRKTEDGWTVQAARAAEAETNRLRQEGFAAERDREDAAWVVESRHWDDRQRFLDHYGTRRKQDLEQQLTDAQTVAKAVTSANKAQEEALTGAVMLGDTTAAQRLAALKESDRTAQAALKTQSDSIKEAIAAEDKLAAQQKFDLESERIAATRAHEDRLRQIDSRTKAETERVQALERAEAALDTQRQIADTRAQWALEDLRAAADAKYAADRAAADAQLKSDQDHATKLGEAATATADALTSWQKVAGFAGSAANALLTVLPGLAAVDPAVAQDAVRAKYRASTVGIKTATGVPIEQFPQPGASRSDARGGMTVNLNLGDVSLMLSERDKEDIRRFVEKKLSDANGAARLAAQGGRR